MEYLITLHCVFIALLGFSNLINADTGDITIQGCTEAFFRMTCPQDDVVSIADLRFTRAGSGRVCNQTRPDHSIAQTPRDMMHLCRTVAGKPDCVYVEDICEGVTDCVFYVSPHLIADKELPNVNSEVIIKYACLAGRTRKAGIAVCALLAAVSMISILTIGGLLLRRMWVPPPDYSNFRNEVGAPGRPVGEGRPAGEGLPPPTSGYGAAAPPPGSSYRGHATTTHTSRVINDPEHISVELQTPPGGGQQPLDAPV